MDDMKKMKMVKKYSVDYLFPLKYELKLHQSFSLPSSVIYYIKKDEKSPKVYQKLIKSCKYFFSANNPIPLHNLVKIDQRWHADAFECYYNLNDAANTNIKKYWLTGHLMIGYNSNTFFQTFYKKVYRCDIHFLSIIEQTISLVDFIGLTSSEKFSSLHLQHAIIKYDNGGIVQLEKIVELFPNLTSFYFYDVDLISSPKSAKELVKVINRHKLGLLFLDGLRETFNFDVFASFIKDNPQIKFALYFAAHLLEDYKQKLEAFIDEIIKDGRIENQKSRFITFPELSHDKHNAMRKLLKRK